MTTTQETTTPKVRRDVEAQIIEDVVGLALKAYEKHEIVSRTDTSIVMRKRDRDGKLWSREYEIEIVAGALGFLMLTGDADTVVFARHGGTLRQRLAWIAPDVGRSFSYLREKASIGMDDGTKLSLKFEPELVDDMLEDVLDGFDPKDEEDAKRIQEIKEVFESPPGHESDLYDFYERLSDAGFDTADWGESLHMVSPRVIYAWAACRRAGQLLDALDEG